ncbi:hypothetical protein GCM10023347_29740 [Streptomyces chumphonensis]|uniref:AfsR/SARP family transcriptional regulator n=1 Tax=Streptomyces chumphonensis TaxID=1214925 RepID=A0A927ICE3_9ACTN|nr:AfsR/SARP family transcriptional regulator [Streptomyces chumphonensis]MBD3931156.1 AfsR/SARP family transcriptional regulator [Streptomyces chumphonensis]
MSGSLLRHRHTPERRDADRVHVTLFGPLEVRRGAGDAVRLGPPRQRALLAVLLLRSTPVGADQLIAALWGQEPPAYARNLVQKYVSGLRSALRDHGTAIDWSDSGYLLDPGAAQVDVYVYERLTTEAASAVAAGRTAEAAALLDEARQLRTGPLAEGLEAPLLERQRVFAEARRLADNELRTEIALELGEHREVVPYLRCLLHEHPLHERLVWLLMTALYRSDRSGEALAVYRELRRRTGDELGGEPGPALRELHVRVLRQDPELLTMRVLAARRHVRV